MEALGFELPEPEKPVGRKNNRKMTFDSACRVLLFDVAKKHGLQLEEEPEYGGRAYLEKQDYINKLCTRTLYDPDGQPRIRVDEYMKRRLEIKLIHSIVSMS